MESVIFEFSCTMQAWDTGKRRRWKVDHHYCDLNIMQVHARKKRICHRDQAIVERSEQK